MLVVKASEDPVIARQAIAAVVNRDVDAMVHSLSELYKHKPTYLLQ